MGLTTGAVADPLLDSFGRIATDLRISLTDRCNFRCRYCMPPEGLPWMAADDLLTFDEITRIARLMTRLGITSIKLTGGEPLVRRNADVVVRELRAISSDLDLSMTTNGFLLADVAEELAAAGLDRVTVSCDSLLRHRFAEMTLRDALDGVMRGLEAAEVFGLTPIKINTVLIRGINDDEIETFAQLARRTGYEVRFIEYMPLDAQEQWDPARVVPGADAIRRIDERWPLRTDESDAPNPAKRYVFADGAPGTVGVIPSVTEPFCSTCNRLRLTADGQLRSCLFSMDEVDLRGPLRAQATDGELEQLIRACVKEKWAGHKIGEDDFIRPSRSMSMIGG